MSSAVLPLVLREDGRVVVTLYDEQSRSLKELAGPEHTFTGDCRECEICFNPARPNAFAHATTTHLRYIEVVEGEDGHICAHLLFEVPMPHTVVALSFSPKGSFLVAYAVMDPKRTPDGNMSIFDVGTGQLLRRCLQARWPSLVWTAGEEYAVRLVQGWLHVLDGNLRTGEAEVVTTLAEGDDHGAEPGPKASAALCKMDLMLAQDKEIEFSTPANVASHPLLALFTPFYKQRQATFSLYRLPHLDSGPLFQVTFARSESASIHWSSSCRYIALLVKSERDPSGKSYYGTVGLHLVDVMNRSTKHVKLVGDGETVHDCQWSPTADELLVVHGTMPRNKATLFNAHGTALCTFGEGPRNMARWAPNGRALVLGGSGNLAGDFKFYDHHHTLPSAGEARPASVAPQRQRGKPTPPVPSAAPAACTGEFNEKSSFQSWAPDSHHFLCSTVYTRLRMDNKLVLVKRNGERVLTVKYDLLYGAEWVTMKPPASYPERMASPRPSATEKPKSGAYRAPGGGSRASAMLSRTADTSALEVKPGGPVGGTVVVQRKKKRR